MKQPEPSANPSHRVDHTQHRDLMGLVKANDLSDDQIHCLWVSLERSPSTPSRFFRPDSPMATLILGGKGSGKTHLLRYFAYPVQPMRHKDTSNPINILARDQYVGVYTRAGDLNSARFHGKGIDNDSWLATFGYYVDLCLGQSFLDVMKLVFAQSPETPLREATIVDRCRGCFYPGVLRPVDTIAALAEQLKSLQETLDSGVSEVAFTRKLRLEIGCNQGGAIFGFPAVFCDEVHFMKGLTIAYHIDEYEDFHSYQQQYVNTLLRMRRTPVTFRIGARAYGMKTFRTYSANEEIRDGSEYELLQLDNYFRADAKSYNRFARELLGLRILGWAGRTGVQELSDEFCTPTTDQPDSMRYSAETSGAERPHLSRLRSQLQDVIAPADRQRIIDLLRCPESPLMEKVAIYGFYQRYAKKENNPVDSACEVRGYLRDVSEGIDNPLREIRKHFSDDFRAQLLRDFRERPVAPTDLDTLITLSEGLPRVFLTIMKNIFRWAEFEKGTLHVQAISHVARQRGLMEAADWFRRDTPRAGPEGERIALAVARLGELFRMNRFADKPIECSLIGFSAPVTGYSGSARDTLQSAVNRSFLIQSHTGEKDRNSAQVRNKYHLNRVLCPLFELPIGRRGATRFDAHSMNVIFGTLEEGPFDDLKRRWNSRLNWPFGRSDDDSDDQITGRQASLF